MQSKSIISDDAPAAQVFLSADTEGCALSRTAFTSGRARGVNDFNDVRELFACDRVYDIRMLSFKCDSRFFFCCISRLRTNRTNQRCNREAFHERAKLHEKNAIVAVWVPQAKGRMATAVLSRPPDDSAGRRAFAETFWHPRAVFRSAAQGQLQLLCRPAEAEPPRVGPLAVRVAEARQADASPPGPGP